MPKEPTCKITKRLLQMDLNGLGDQEMKQESRHSATQKNDPKRRSTYASVSPTRGIREAGETYVAAINKYIGRGQRKRHYSHMAARWNSISETIDRTVRMANSLRNVAMEEALAASKKRRVLDDSTAAITRYMNNEHPYQPHPYQHLYQAYQPQQPHQPYDGWPMCEPIKSEKPVEPSDSDDHHLKKQ